MTTSVAKSRKRPDGIQKNGSHPNTKRAKGSSTRSRARGGGSLKGKIRGIERLLAHRGDSMPAAARASALAELSSLRALATDRTRRENERGLAKQYRMVRFFERRKIERKLQLLREASARPGANQEDIASRKKELEEDLEYVKNFPKGRKYVALYPSGGHSEQSKLEVNQIRLEIKRTLAGQVDVEHTTVEAEKDPSGADDFFLED